MMSEANPYASPQFGGKEMMGTTGQLASLGDRFLAALIDGLIAAPIQCVLGIGLSIVLALSPLKESGLLLSLVSSVLGAGMGLGIYLAIHGHLLSTRGQTIGKMVMKTQIVSDDGSPVPFATIVLKRILPIAAVSCIPYLGLVALIDPLMIFRSSRKCLHDDIAGTKVIKLAG